MVELASWILGCVNMTASLAFSAIGYHKKSLDETGRNTMARAVNMHQVSAIGFLILANMPND